MSNGVTLIHQCIGYFTENGKARKRTGLRITNNEIKTAVMQVTWLYIDNMTIYVEETNNAIVKIIKLVSINKVTEKKYLNISLGAQR